ncbi:MAG: metallophosphoesterase [Dysgonamonadaceae bacterium]
MKRDIEYLFTLLFLLAISALLFPIAAQTTKIGVISDLHYAHPSIIGEKGEALSNYLKKDRKLILESEALLLKTVSLLIDENVNLVLIPGDLSKDGEKISHQGVADILQPLLSKGVKILVIPGNHDIDNPEAARYDGSYTSQVESVTPKEFSEIYKEFGYGEAISLDSFSLSYVSEPVDGLRVICIDDCRYYDNTFISRGDKEDKYITAGRIKPETLKWIKTEIQVAKLLGKDVIGMMHHNVVEHFDYQSFFMLPYIVEDFKNVQKLFLEEGLSAVFTGHFHATDISAVNDETGNSLYDIETGSIVTYPCPYRIVDYNDGTLSIKTKYIQEINYPLGDSIDFQTYAREQLQTGIHEMISSMIHAYYDYLPGYIPTWGKSFIKFPEEDKLTTMIFDHSYPPLVEMIPAHYCGNEPDVIDYQIKKENMINGIDDFIDDFADQSITSFTEMSKKYIKNTEIIRQLKSAVISIWDDTNYNDQTNDLDLVIYSTSERTNK